MNDIDTYRSHKRLLVKANGFRFYSDKTYTTPLTQRTFMWKIDDDRKLCWASQMFPITWNHWSSTGYAEVIVDRLLDAIAEEILLHEEE